MSLPYTGHPCGRLFDNNKAKLQYILKKLILFGKGEGKRACPSKCNLFILFSKILKMGGNGWVELSVLIEAGEKKMPATWPAEI